MLLELKTMSGLPIKATDGEIGKVDDFYFSDLNWSVRYAVVKLGSWLVHRKVLIPVKELVTPEPDIKSFPVDITREQVRKSPDIDWQQPVSREMEMKLFSHFGWVPYWYPGTVAPAIPIPVERQWPDVPESELRSANAVRGYGIRSTTGNIGHVDEFLAGQDWVIHYLIVDTSNWPGGKTVVVPSYSVASIHWDVGVINVELTEETIHESPELDRAHPDQAFERKVQRYYAAAAVEHPLHSNS